MDFNKAVGYVGFYAEQATDVIQLLISILVLLVLLRAYQFTTQIIEDKKKKDN